MLLVSVAGMMLVAGAGWLVRTFANLRNTNVGFVADNRLLFDVTFAGQRYPTPDAVRDLDNAIAVLVSDMGGPEAVATL